MFACGYEPCMLPVGAVAPASTVSPSPDGLVFPVPLAGAVLPWRCWHPKCRLSPPATGPLKAI